MKVIEPYQEYTGENSPVKNAVNKWPTNLKMLWIATGGVIGLLWLWSVVKWLTLPGVLHDFVQDWASARNYLTGQPIYWNLHEAVRYHLGDNWVVEVVDVNAHPPASVLLALPFGLLDYQPAYIAWNVVSLGLLALSLWLIVHPKGLALSAWILWPIATILFVSNPLKVQIHHGQFNLILLALITGAWVAQRQERQVLSGALIGVAAAIKLFPAFLALYFLSRRQWRALGAVCVSFFLVNALAAAVLGVESYAAYFSDVLPKVERFRDYWPNASLAGFWTKLLNAHSGHVVSFTQSPLLANAAIFTSWALVIAFTATKTMYARTLEQRDQAFALSLVAMLLVSPITWDHYLLLLTLPAVIMWKYTESRQSSRIMLMVLVAVLTISPTWIWNAVIPGDGELAFGPGETPSVAQPIHVITVISYLFYALLALFFVGVFSRTEYSDMN